MCRYLLWGNGQKLVYPVCVFVVTGYSQIALIITPPRVPLIVKIISDPFLSKTRRVYTLPSSPGVGFYPFLTQVWPHYVCSPSLGYSLGLLAGITHPLDSPDDCRYE